jgi:hypothetical protein
MHSTIKVAFDTFPDAPRAKLLELRELILRVAAANPAIGELEETLKWSEPAYLTTDTGAGTTVRIGWKPVKPEVCAVYVHCQTTLIDSYRGLFPELNFQGNRAVEVPVDQPLQTDALAHCIEMALTYHLDKRRALQSAS